MITLSYKKAPAKKPATGPTGGLEIHRKMRQWFGTSTFGMCTFDDKKYKFELKILIS